MRIAALERHIEVTLLVRTSRGSRLSLDGQVFLPHAKKVVAAIEQAERPCAPEAVSCVSMSSIGASPRPRPSTGFSAPTPRRTWTRSR